VAMLLLGLSQLTMTDRGMQRAALLPARPRKAERGQGFLLHKAAIGLERSRGCSDASLMEIKAPQIPLCSVIY